MGSLASGKIVRSAKPLATMVAKQELSCIAMPSFNETNGAKAYQTGSEAVDAFRTSRTKWPPSLSGTAE